LAAGGWGSVYPVFLAFALGRALPTGTMTLMSGEGSAAVVRRFRSIATYLFIGESVLLMALAVIWFWR
jgi:cytochrome c biogenesis protein CcdA